MADPELRDTEFFSGVFPFWKLKPGDSGPRRGSRLR